MSIIESMSFVVFAIFCMMLLLIVLMYGRLQYYRGQTESQTVTIQELERQVIYLSHAHNKEAAEYLHEIY